jgi:uncharacterized protein
MQFNVAQLLKEPVGSTRVYRIDDQVAFDADTLERVRGKLRLMRTDKAIWASAGLQVFKGSTCSRCLSPFRLVLKLIIEEEYFPTVDVTTGVRLSVPEASEGSFTLTPQHILDLQEAVRQCQITAMPMKPLCRPDCAGLCSNCGANLNLGPCSCHRQMVDPRWGPLTRLLPRSHG